jgi:putative spermidine/putrescine transport system substrate-binding protein
MFKKSFAVLMTALVILFSCSPENSKEVPDTWDEIVSSAAGATVQFYMWSGSAEINSWIDGPVSQLLKEEYSIILKRVPSDASVFVNKLINEKAAGKMDGSIDLVWINGENFKNAREADVLYGPFADRLPNFIDYVDADSVATDFGYPVDGYESPYGRAQFVFEYDSAVLENPPASFAELVEFVRENPGRFTYPQPPDFTGSAFIRQAFYAVSGGADQYLAGFDQQLFDSNSSKLWDYFKRIGALSLAGRQNLSQGFGSFGSTL